MKNVVTLSGWGQNYDALNVIAPDANHICYQNFDSADEFLKSLSGLKCDILIGWSLGGQLALRAVSYGILKPSKLILIATPFQFVTGRGLKCGMDIDNFNNFDAGFLINAEKTLKKFALMVAKNDAKAKEIARTLQSQKNVNIDKWEYWLEELGRFTCQKLDFSKMPDTIIVHGVDDTIVDVTQTSFFKPLMKNCKLEIIDNCGHAPHLHDVDFVSELVRKSAKEAK